MVWRLQLTSDKNPAKQKFGQKQSYQYWRNYDSGWTISVVCREGMNGADAGLFEMAVWNNSVPKFETMVIVTASADFTEISNLVEEFKEDPERFYKHNGGGNDEEE
jgi:hypothetical protein